MQKNQKPQEEVDVQKLGLLDKSTLQQTFKKSQEEKDKLKMMKKLNRKNNATQNN